MKLRTSLVIVLAALSFVGCGSQYFMMKDAYAPVKKVALVQYVINPHIVLGTPANEDARVGTATAAWDIYAKVMANQHVTTPFADMTANAAYSGAGGKTAWEGYYTAKGAQFFSADVDTLESATIPADTAKKLAEGLGVDGVVVVYEGWGTAPFAFGFKAHSRNAYVINLFDKTGARVWGDVVWGEADGEGFATPGGVVSCELPIYLADNAKAMTVALNDAQNHISGK